MRTTRRVQLHQNFQAPVQAAEDQLTVLGFRVLKRTPTHAIFDGPKKTSSRSALTYFSRIALSHHHRNLHLTALSRQDDSAPKSSVAKYLPPIAVTALATLIAISFHVDDATTRAITTMILLINLCVAAVISLYPAPVDEAREAHKALDHFFRAIVGPKAASKRPKKLIRVTPKAKLRCAYCHDDLHNAPRFLCPDCHTQIHEECRHELDACPTFGCANTELFTPAKSRSTLFRFLSPTGA